MLPITYLTGDATEPQADGNAIICHVCNDAGGWGKGFVTALSRRWSAPEAAYRAWFAARKENDFGLGSIQLVEVGPALWVANPASESASPRYMSKRGSRTSGHAVAQSADPCIASSSRPVVSLQTPSTP